MLDEFSAKLAGKPANKQPGAEVSGLNSLSLLDKDDQAEPSYFQKFPDPPPLNAYVMGSSETKDPPLEAAFGVLVSVDHVFVLRLYL